MAVLIPALSTCIAQMTAGERRVGGRLQQKLDDDCLVWFDVPVGPKQCHPDFVVLHPRRGLLILETRDWRLDAIQKASRGDWLIAPDGVPKSVPNPIEQARHQALQVVDALKRDAQLIQHEGKWQGMLTFPWSYGVVFTRITRKQFAAGLGNAIESNRVVCSDEMLEDAEPEAFRSQLWDMFPQLMRGTLSLPQIDRVRWNLFPEVRVPEQSVLFDDADDKASVPDFLPVMDLQQEQLARSLGDGHRVIHGVAESDKTMILGYRAEHLAKAATDLHKPVLVLCYSEPLAVKLQASMQAKALAGRVHVRQFHKWCRDQLAAFGQPLPSNDLPVRAKMDQMVRNVIDGVDRKMIPSGQYLAVLVDEGHDFAPAWLKLVTQMVDPTTNSLLLLYDDAQSLYESRRGKPFSYKSVGVQAQGRTTILKINSRNTRQILQTASAMATELLQPREKEEEGRPLVQPCGRGGPEPIVVDLPSTRAQADWIAKLMASAHDEGHGWGGMAVLCRSWALMDECARALARRRLPHKVRKGAHDFDPAADTIKVMTLHASKGLEFSVVAVMGARQAVVGYDAATQEDDALEGLFYVGATRAMSRLMIANVIRQ